MDILKSNLGKYLLAVLGILFLVGMIFREYLHSGVIINATDILTQDYFWHAFYHEQLRGSPSFVTWNPYLNGGATFYGGLHLIFQPISLLSTYFFSPHFAITVEGLSHLILAAVFTIMYARLIGLSFKASFLSAVFFIFSTEIVSLFNAGHIGKLNTIALFPLVLLLLERALQKRRFIDFVLLAVALSIQFYEGHIQISFYTCVVVAIYFIARSVNIYSKGRSLKDLRQLYAFGTVMVLLFLTLSAASFANWLEFKKQSERGEGTPYEFATSWSMPKKELATYLVPQLFGLSRENYKDPKEIDIYYWGDMSFTQTSDYLGLIPLILATLALIKYRNRYVLIFFILMVLFQVLAFGKYTPVYYLFYKYLGFKFFRVPKMVLFVVAFSVAILAGYGAQWLLGEIDKKDRKFLARFVLSLAGGVVLFFILGAIAEIYREGLVRYFARDLRGHGPSYNPSLIIPRYEYAVEGIWVASVLLAASIAIVSLRFVKKINVNILFGLIAIFYLADTSLLNYKFINALSMKGNDYFSRDTAVRYFEENPGSYRVLNAIQDRTMKSVPYRVPNKYILFKIFSVTGYEAVQLARYSAILDSLNFENNVMDLLGVKYVVVLKNQVGGKVGDRFGKYEIVVDEDVKILKSNSYLPRAFPVHRAAVLDDKRSILMWLRSPSFKPDKMVMLEEPVEGVMSKKPLSEKESEVAITSFENTEIMMDANMAENGFVVLSEKYYPGWKAYIDGVETKIYQANYAFRALYVPKGSHKIVMRYEPESYKRGLFITLSTLLCVSVILIRHTCDVKRSCHGKPKAG